MQNIQLFQTNTANIYYFNVKGLLLFRIPANCGYYGQILLYL